MLLYVTIFALFALLGLGIRAPRLSHHAAMAAGLFLVLFIGGRYQVGCDWSAYFARYAFLYPTNYDWSDALFSEEGGFHLINVLARDFEFGFLGVVMICGLLFAACLTRFALVAPRPMAFMAIAFPILVIQLGMSGLRQACATAFLLLSYVAFVRGRRLTIAAWVFVASMFHVSAAIFLPMALLPGRRVSTKHLALAVVLMAPVAGWLLGGRLDIYTDRYVDQIYGESASSGAWFRYAYAVFPFLLAMWKGRLLERDYPRLYPILRLFAFATFGLVLVGLVSSVALHRLTYYVLPVSLLCLLCVVESVFHKRSRSIVWLMVFAIYGAYVGGWFLTSRHAASCYVPYQSWLMGGAS
jgi:hypothetical protein